MALLLLIVLQLFHARNLYYRTLNELNTHIENVLSKTMIKHEKATDFQRYTQIFNKDFSGQYKSALKQEFQNLVPVQETVSIRDTFILVNNKKTKYLYITGSAYDSISDVKTEHSVLARDISELSDFMKSLNSNDDKNLKPDSLGFAFDFDKKVITNLFKKSKYINELMANAFRSLDFLPANERINLPFLDSILSQSFIDEGVYNSYSYVITDEENKVVSFDNTCNTYNADLNINKAYSSKLFPGNIFDETLTLHFQLDRRASALFSEMWSSLLISLLLFIMVLYSFYVMFKTILRQRHLAEMKSDFISNMTHEFKTPISTISLACEAMSDQDLIGEKEIEVISPYIKMINQENKRLEDLVERILQSALIEKGRLKLKKEHLELNEIVALAVSKAKIRVHKSGGNINLELAKGMLNFEGDPMHTTNVISNLIDNAIKYSKEKVEITIKTERIENGCQFVISDQGIGIKQEHIDKIFDKLYRVPTGNVHDVKGFGLGLNYVKAITDIEGWKIKVDSKINIGSTFTLSIINEN